MRPAPAGQTGSGWRCSTRRSSCARPVTPARSCPGWRSPGSGTTRRSAAGVELSAYSVDQLDEIAAAARQAGQTRRASSSKLDSGLGRGGAHPDDWAALVDDGHWRCATRAAVEVTGVWSHLACSDEPGHPSIAAQTAEFEDGVGYAVDAGLEPQHVHLANSGGVLASPETWFSMVRPGIAIYGVSPFADGTQPGAAAARR